LYLADMRFARKPNAVGDCFSHSVRGNTYLVPVQKWPFSPNSSLLCTLYPRDIKFLYASI